MRKLTAGFTLVELLVVIAIIAILSVIGLVVFTQVQKDARDAKRLADINAIQNALEEYYLVHGFYPAPPVNEDVSPSLLTVLNPYFSGGVIPHDPNPSEGGPAVRRPTFDYGYLACQTGSITSPKVARQYYLCTYISNCSGKCNADTELGIPLGNVTLTLPYPCDKPSPLKPLGQGTNFFCVRSRSN